MESSKKASLRDKLLAIAERKHGATTIDLPAGLEAKVRGKVEGNIPVDLYNKETGEIVSTFPFEREAGRYRSFDTIKPKSSFLPEEYQGKGVASSLYSKLEDALNAKVIPDDYQTEAGDMLHEKAGYGKKFGLSNKFLSERLSDSEKADLSNRRGAVERGLRDVLEQKVSDFDEAKEIMEDQAMRIASPEKRETVQSTIHNALRRAAKGAEEGPVDLDRLASLKKLVNKRVLSALPGASMGAAMLAGTSPAEAAAEELLPPGMEPDALGPERGSEEYNLETGRIPDKLKYAEGGILPTNDAVSLKPILKDVYSGDTRKNALKAIRSRKPYKPRKPK
jgi:hypothetical protein